MLNGASYIPVCSGISVGWSLFPVPGLSSRLVSIGPLDFLATNYLYSSIVVSGYVTASLFAMNLPNPLVILWEKFDRAVEPVQNVVIQSRNTKHMFSPCATYIVVRAQNP